VDLGKVLLSSLRNVDLMGRIGGEEFQVIAPETNSEGAEVLGERIRSTVERAMFSYLEENIPVRVSIGFAVAGDGEATDYEHMRHVAGAALAQAKVSGRNCCVVYLANRPPFEQAG
jgi:diguanylate cyclase (GGDEF)-like protein